jgi:transposase
MAYLKAKTIKGKKYYYIVESKRVNGKPKPVNQVYLGTIEQVLALKQQTQGELSPPEVAVYEFGLVAACFHFAQELNLVSIIDQHIPKRAQGLSVGHYLLIAAISRAVAPISKQSCWDWFRQTSLPRLMSQTINSKELSSQRFWDHMDKVPISVLSQIEQAISHHLLAQFDLDLRCLIYDTTNYFTFIDTFNTRNQIAKRGKSKQKRNDLRQVNLALAVTPDFHIPLFHRLYDGNHNDCTSFPTIIQELVTRYQVLGQYCQDITLVYDKGNNSQSNQEQVDGSPYHFIGGLQLDQCPELSQLETTSNLFHAVDDERLEGITAYRTHGSVFGQERTMVVTFSPGFYEKQNATILRDIQKASHHLKALQTKLQRRIDKRAKGEAMPGKPPTYHSVQKQINASLTRQYMKDIIHPTITEHDRLITFSYHFDTEKLAEIQKTRLGKTILFTDQHHWTTPEIILGYRGQYQVEDAFKTSKRGHFMAWRPTFHWTDQKLHVHAFYCMLALLFVSLIHRQVWMAGLKIGVPTLEKELRGIKEVIIVQVDAKQKLGKTQVCRTLTKMENQQHAIYQALNLEKYRPK